MSYDLMVFEPAHAPKNRAEFMIWYDQQTKWSEPHAYDDPAVTTDRLRSWYEDMERVFPNMHSPCVTDDDLENSRLTDYSFGHSVIYVAFAWSLADEAYHAARELAQKHAVGFFDASADEGDILNPGIDRPLARTPWWKKLFRPQT